MSNWGIYTKLVNADYWRDKFIDAYEKRLKEEMAKTERNYEAIGFIRSTLHQLKQTA